MGSFCSGTTSYGHECIHTLCKLETVLHETTRELMRQPHNLMLQIPKMHSRRERVTPSTPQNCINCRGQLCHFPQETITRWKPINTTKEPRISFQAHPLVRRRRCCKLPLLSDSPPSWQLPSKALATNGFTPLHLLVSRAGLLAGHLHMPAGRLQALPSLAWWLGSVPEEEPDGDDRL
jgi:hypothetical protein